MTFTEEFEELLRAFKKFNVDYMLVGAYALNFHGYNRSTSDLYVWAKSSVENQNKINAVLRYMGFAEQGLNQLCRLILISLLFLVWVRNQDVWKFLIPLQV